MSVKYPDLINTNFPESSDDIALMLPLLVTDMSMVKQYQEYMLAGDFANASAVLSSIPNYNQKIISVEYLNKVRDALVALERFYGTDIAQYVTDKQAEWLAVINQFTYKGVYDPSVLYLKDNYVEFTIGGSTMMYICYNSPPVGTPPTNTAHWRLLTIKGEQGPTAEGISFMFTYDPSVVYNLDNLVIYNGYWWISTANDNQGNQPESGSAFWNPFLQVTQTGFVVSITQPPIQSIGDLWFDIVGDGGV